MHINTLDILIIIVYLAAVLGIGLYQALKIRSSGDYYAGGRKFNKFYLMMHALGTASHADEPVSVIGGAYESGLSGIWYTYLYLPLTPIFWLLAPYIRRTRFVTMADFFRVRFNRSLANLYSVIGVLKMSVAMGVVLKGTATIFKSIVGDSMGPHSDQWAIGAMTVIFVIYGFAGGLRATVVTETIQGPLIVLMSLLLLPFGLAAAGGFHGIHQALDPKMFSFWSSNSTSYEFSGKWIGASILTALIGWVAQPGLVAAVGSGKTELEGRVGYTYGTMIKRFCAMGWVFTGIILAAMAARHQLSAGEASALNAKAGRELAFGIAIQHFFPHGMLGLTFAAIFASQMATLSAQMVNSSALASRNIYRDIFRPDATDAQVLAVGRIAGIFLVVLGIVLAESLSSVANALTMLLQFSSIMGVIVWAGVIWRRVNPAGAWVAAIVLFTLWSMFGPLGMLIQQSAPNDLPHWIGMYGREQFVFELMLCYLPAGIAALILVSLFSTPQPRKQLDDFFLLLKTPVGQEQKLIDAGVPILYAGSTQANELETKYPRLVHWGGCALAAAICLLILGVLKFLANVG
jgi:Na+/proline symporter